MLFVGQHLIETKTGTSHRVCMLSKCNQFVATANMHTATKNNNVKKPTVFRVSDLTNIFGSSTALCETYPLPAEMTFSDEQLKRLRRANWLNKRDIKWTLIDSLCSDELIHKYLFGKGLNEEIRALVENDDHPWKSRGAFFNAINRFSVFGMTPNALLPVRLKLVGSNYKTFEKPSDTVVKRGRGGKNNEFSRSKSRGISEQDKRNIHKVLKHFGKNHKKMSLKRAYETYQDHFETTEISRDIGDSVAYNFIPHAEEESLSFSQFYYHSRNIMSKADLIKLNIGELSFKKDYEDRQGSACDGLLGATHRYEVDATVLDLYVRYPYDTTGVYSMGRPVFYVVVDVYSTMIVGFYVGFDGPNWMGVSQALVNACSDKVEFAKRYGLKIKPEDWPAHHIPREISIDNGTEYPDALLESILKSEIGVSTINLAAVFRGDAKGTVEKKFDVLNKQAIHFAPGAIVDHRREEQHPSNESFYDLNGLIAMLITEVIYHNRTADRLKKFNWQCAVNGIDITPNALFQHSLAKDMHGGRPTGPEDNAKVRWAFLKEESASVRQDAIYFDGLEYECNYAKTAGWYARARHHGSFKICVKRVRDWCNSIWHKTDCGQYIELSLKHINNDSPSLNMHWEPVLHRLELNKDLRHHNTLSARKLRADKKAVQASIDDQMRKEIGSVQRSERKSMQPKISERKHTQKLVSTAEHAAEAAEIFSHGKVIEQSAFDDFDLDSELYD
jgi:hypothetical protein